MVLGGVLFGLAAAASQSVAYVFSRRFVLRPGRATTDLLLVSHVLMGAVCVAALPLLWSGQVASWRQWALPMAGVAGFYLAGQAGLFLLVRQLEASRVSPLLALKILVLAGITSLGLHRPLAATQWFAVGLSVVAAWVLNRTGVRLTARQGLLLLLICTGYSLSDLSIERMVPALGAMPRLRASAIGVTLTYALCGALALVVLPFAAAARRVPRDAWREGAGFAFFWLAGMVFLFACFASVGAVYGNILQSTRGVLSIALGYALARRGFVHLEERVSGPVMARRMAAAVLLSAAIWLFQAGAGR